LHPYTQALLSAVPIPNPRIKKKRIILEGNIPSPLNPPRGCAFHTRCKHAKDICKKIAPEFKEVEDRHFTACHLY
jgi:oligopeptide/dipeptide ABC transporter ATP-binding protein